MRLLVTACALVLCVPAYVKAQEQEILFLGDVAGCDYSGAVASDPVYAFMSTTSARQAVRKITASVGIPANFVVMAANIPNARAVISDGKNRMLLYNQEFISRITDESKNDWAAISIMAHEIGHHLAGHTLSTLADRHKAELEADSFSGQVVRNLGGSLEQAVSAIKFVPEAETDTHPSRSARRQAVTLGWTRADERYKQERTTQVVDKEIVRKIQRLLSLMKFDPGNSDGLITNTTRAAIAAFERTRRLDITGQPSRELSEHLNGAMQSGFSNLQCSEVTSHEQECRDVPRQRSVPDVSNSHHTVRQTIPCYYQIAQFCNVFGQCDWRGIERNCEDINNGRQQLALQCSGQISDFDIGCSCGPLNCFCNTSAECGTSTSTTRQETYYEKECRSVPTTTEQCTCRAPEVCLQ